MTDPELAPTASSSPALPGGTGPVAPTSNAHLLAPVGLVLAGLVGLIGGLLPWVSISVSAGGATQSIQGPALTGSSDGPWRTVAVLLGAIILISAAGYLFGRRNRRLLGVVAVLSLLLLGVGIYKIIDVYRQAEVVYQQMDQLMARVQAEARGNLPLSFRDLFHIGPGTGLWMVAGAGLLGSVLAVFQLLRTPKSVVAEGWQPLAPPPPPPVRPGTPAHPGENGPPADQ